MVFGNNDPLQMAQQAQQREAAIVNMQMQTASRIYANLVVRLESPTPDLLRALAKNAKVAAAFLTEAYGLTKVQVEEKNDGVDGS